MNTIVGVCPLEGTRDRVVWASLSSKGLLVDLSGG